MKDSYQTILEPTEGLYKEKGSKFIAYAKSVNSREAFHQFLDDIKKEHSKARHHCYAYRLGVDGKDFRSNDDGEPSGTAGRPILGQIDRLDLTQIGIIVVRYFGGTKLGTGGLKTAYKEASREALAAAKIQSKPILKEYKVAFDYKWMSDILAAAKKTNMEILKKEFNENPFIHVGIKRTETEASWTRFNALILKKSLEEVDSKTEIEGIKIEEII